MPITAQEALARVIVHREIFYDEMVELMRQVMAGEVSPVMTAAILIGLRVKKETVGEIAGAAAVMREFAAKVEVPDRAKLVDIVGTGGDGANTFNISTASMFVCAAAGARVAKHGNRGVSSKSGSADVLEALGAHIELPPGEVASCIAETGIGFMYAPLHHPAMRNVGPVRSELGVRTLFNILGPLTNPAGAPNILMGVFHADLVGIQARVLQRLGAKRALVVHGRDGLDELTLSGATLVAELRDERIEEYEVLPGEFGLPMADLAAIRVDSPAQSRQLVLQVLEDRDGPARDIVLLNAGAALYAAGVAASIGDGVEKARLAISSGAALAKLHAYVAATRRMAALSGAPAA
jgi:anthranilate phosphoribosyltransferase